jgi:poly-gamma-glutamate synthesis protein (capsule biosynthesis protein)
VVKNRILILENHINKTIVVKSVLTILFIALFGFQIGIPVREESNHFGIQDSLIDSTMSLLFIGDIMGHGPQIQSAFCKETGRYSFDTVFHYMKATISEPDFTIANFEVTLGGKPFTGYPQFSSPDALAIACKNAGIDVFMTANNHCVDRGLSGLNRTIEILDSFEITHTGTFSNQESRDEMNLIVLEKNGIRAGLLNYSYGTNGIPVPEPSIVNIIDKALMKRDIDSAKMKGLDQIIVFLHFGNEYELKPNVNQISIVDFLFEAGVDVVIGSHPHVIQKMMFMPGKDSIKDRFVAYSLGNFVSNQRKTDTDGGVLAYLKFKKKNGKVFIVDHEYILTWVYKKVTLNGKTEYFILPASEFEHDTVFFESDVDFEKMNYYIERARTLMDTQNMNVTEKTYKETPDELH